MPIIRPAQADDLARITEIYGHHVLHGTGTFETTPPSQDEMRNRWQDVCSKGLPWLVVTDSDSTEGQVIGFAYGTWFKPRPAYRYSAEDSIYLAPEAAGKGLGKALMAELLTQLELAGVRKVMAVIGDSANAASVGLHTSLGFEPAGTINACGWKFNRWLDIVLMQRSLGPGGTCPPDAEEADR
ncbi:N-acetyltransferase family protein [Hydrogenophaga sp. 5NK40-0174]|uniref:GNAT family N-acetyltransferase n=1 Tax=Hydrogenophaga sp. 5NK40-0174 TaxID=3127649 RepID=UPI003104CE2D